MKVTLKKQKGDVFLELLAENVDEEIEIAGFFLTNKIFVQYGLPKVETGRLRKLIFKLQKREVERK